MDLLLTCLVFKKGASYFGIRVFNNLPQSITSLRNEKPQFKAAPPNFFLCAHWFYCMDGYFARTDNMYYGLIWLCKYLHCNNFMSCMLLYVFDMFHILLSGDGLRDLWKRERERVCVCVCVCACVCVRVRERESYCQCRMYGVRKVGKKRRHFENLDKLLGHFRWCGEDLQC